MDMGLFLNFSIYSMNITFEFMETLPKMNTGIFGETGASSGDAADRQGPAVRPGNQPGPRSAQHLPISWLGLRGR